jgi:phosphoserine aminotransferase
MRVSNFNAGPAALPLPVLERAREELLDFAGTGMSIMEHSHRGKAYEGVHDEAIALLRELAGIPDTHHVLFLQGGASLQFAMLPMNFLGEGRSADYVNTGHWSERAIDEAKYYGRARIAASTADSKFTRVPAAGELDLDPGAAYVHITTNNTIEGTQWHAEPDTGAVPLVADMSSDFLWKKPDVARYGMIYAGAQKNLGPSGVVLVIARKDLVAAGRKDIPKIFRYETFASQNSLYNTPPTFAIYLVRNVLAWIKSVGGPDQIRAWNEEKARLVYGAIDDAPDYYRCPVEQGSRSVMNIVFRLPTEALEEQFVKAAAKDGMVGLKGHRSVGGVRASVYNAVSVDDCRKLAGFMKSFAAANRP